MNEKADRTLICDLIEFAESLQNANKSRRVMQAVNALWEGRRDMDATIELDVYAKLDAQAGNYSDAELLGRAKSAILVNELDNYRP